MAWPTDDLTTTHLDAGGDSPAQARSEILAAVQKLKALLAVLESEVAAAISTHNGVTNPHGATSAATANRLVLRDASGRFKAVAPAATDDVAIKGTVDTHGGLTAPHGATPAATADRLMLRDGSGRAKVAVPAAADDVARLDTVTEVLTGRRFTSAAFTWAANTIATAAHGLGAVPFRVSLVAECISAEHGYAVGDFAYDLVYFMGTYGGVPRFNPVNVRASATNLYFAAGDAEVCVINQVTSSAADPQQITPAKWRLYLRAEL